MLRIMHKTVAARIGFSESGVSMIRAGKRFPMLSTMESIEKAYGWKVEDQVAAREDYAGAFNQMLQDWYANPSPSAD